jgi:hypothetical protein
MSSRLVVALGVLTLFMMSGCNENLEPPVRAPEPGQVFGEHRQKQAAARTKQVGEDCTDSGQSECLSGVCLHTKPGPGEGYICSKQCQQDPDCPEGWRCAGTRPGAAASFCIPPADWAAGAATTPGGER